MAPEHPPRNALETCTSTTPESSQSWSWGHSQERPPNKSLALSVAMRWQNQDAPRKLAYRREAARGRGDTARPPPSHSPATARLPPGRGPRGSGTAGLAPRTPAPLGPGRKGQGARPEPPLGPGKAARPRASPVLAERAAPLVEQAEQQEGGPRQRGVPRRQVLAEGRHGTGRASEPRDRGRASDSLSAGSAGETGRLARRRARAGPAARERPLARAAAPSPPRTLASPAGARAGGRARGSRSPGARSAHARTPAESLDTRRVPAACPRRWSRAPTAQVL